MTIKMLLFCTVWSWTPSARWPMENSCFYCRFYWYWPDENYFDLCSLGAVWWGDQPQDGAGQRGHGHEGGDRHHHRADQQGVERGAGEQDHEVRADQPPLRAGRPHLQPPRHQEPNRSHCPGEQKLTNFALPLLRFSYLCPKNFITNERLRS